MLDRLRTAANRRASLRTADTNALRLVDGAVDGFPNLEVDDFAGRWLVQTRDRGLPDGFGDAALALGASSVYWKQLDQDNKRGPVFVAGDEVSERFEVVENGLRYLIDFSAGYSQGIFLDQRDNRKRLREVANGSSVLNTFAYTCAFGVSAAAGGASEVVNLDLSKNYLAWGRENFALNGLAGDHCDFIYGDALDWMGRFVKRGRTFDVVVIDPPTFSRDAKGRVFSVRDGYERLVGMAVAVLNPGGTLLCSTNYRALDTDGFMRLVRGAVSAQGRGRAKITAGGMPPDFRGEHYLKSLFVTLPE